MQQKKICMIGDFSVGKTSLVSRFVRQTFSDKYLTTVGVKVDTKLVELVDGRQVKLILWDIAGNGALTTATASYLRGAAGYILVVDGTRRPTWDSAMNLQKEVSNHIGDKPFVLLLNKADLRDQWEIGKQLVSSHMAQGWNIIHTSAKTGIGVEEAFSLLSMKMLDT